MSDEKREPRINVYTCRHGHNTVTVDVDEGVTPFFIDCRTEGCKEPAQSSMYPRGPRPPHIPEPAWEWYKPSEAEAEKMSEGMREHVKLGGLDIRPRTDREPLYHEG